MALTSEELNFLVYRYLQESGECAAVVMDVPERNDARQNVVFFADVIDKNGATATPLSTARRSLFCSAASEGLAPFWEHCYASWYHFTCVKTLNHMYTIDPNRDV